jgi:hypothetical protein
MKAYDIIKMGLSHVYETPITDSEAHRFSITMLQTLVTDCFASEQNSRDDDDQLETVPIISISKIGDVNQDGKVTIADAVETYKYLEQWVNLTDEQKRNADIDGDGLISESDAKAILKQTARFVLKDKYVILYSATSLFTQIPYASTEIVRAALENGLFLYIPLEQTDTDVYDRDKVWVKCTSVEESQQFARFTIETPPNFAQNYHDIYTGLFDGTTMCAVAVREYHENPDFLTDTDIPYNDYLTMVCLPYGVAWKWCAANGRDMEAETYRKLYEEARHVGGSGKWNFK